MLGRVILVFACVAYLSTTLACKVTYRKFTPLPMTKEEAKNASNGAWQSLGNCTANQKFRGVRFVNGTDRTVTLLYDEEGSIAGIQTAIKPTESYPPEKQRDHIFQNDSEGNFVLTAYFRHPRHICDTTKSAENKGKEIQLFIQNGSDPHKDFIQIPTKEEELKGTKWTKTKCFPEMGQHYWYSVTKEMKCEDVQPVFLLYNNTSSLLGFGWAMGLDHTSPNFEHPTFDMLQNFMDPVPRCLEDYPRMSSLHIYMTSDPASIHCP